MNNNSIEKVINEICRIKFKYSIMSEEFLHTRYLSRESSTEQETQDEAIWHLNHLNPELAGIHDLAETIKQIHNKEIADYRIDLDKYNDRCNNAKEVWSQNRRSSKRTHY